MSQGTPNGAQPLQLWGGLECTVNRVGDQYFDQIVRTGHETRPDDLDRLAALGVRAIRYPILWERTAPEGVSTANWAWADERMMRLRQLGVRVVVGLVHHGSGPSSTSLLDDAFPDRLAEFAGAVARRYPWVTDYTPINEPLTTARFSALYGHWYPHHSDARSFARALLVEVRATIQSMRAVRRLVPGARLVQTEDIGTIASSESLTYQADYENERRFLSLDLLFGRVTAEHVLWQHLLELGVTSEELAWVADNSTPPDLVGVNYYVTSDRYLDDRLELYPAHTHGGNTRQAYADVEAVRVLRRGIEGHGSTLHQVWQRYRTPLALTEAHLGCAPEEQIRWLREAWLGAEEARAAGADVHAVTLWSVFGSFDWNSLVTRVTGHYEPGAFDVRGPAPRPTALARVAQELGQRGESEHPLVRSPGWWRRETRLRYAPVGPDSATRPAHDEPPIMITSACGALGRALAQACATRGLAARCLASHELVVADVAAVQRTVQALQPWLVIHAEGYPGELTPECHRRARVLVFASSISPRDRSLLATLPQSLIISASDAASPLDEVALELLAHACLDLAIDHAEGSWEVYRDGTSMIARVAPVHAQHAPARSTA